MKKAESKIEAPAVADKILDEVTPVSGSLGSVEPEKVTSDDNEASVGDYLECENCNRLASGIYEYSTSVCFPKCDYHRALALNRGLSEFNPESVLI